MFKIFVDKKTGFEHLSNEIFKIYDGRGIIFYSNYLLKNKKIKFNLPKGNYYSDYQFKKISLPIKHKPLKLPKPNVHRSMDDYLLIFSDNKNKATINPNLRTITFDNYFKTCPLPELYFCFFHECGHSHYSQQGQKSEKLCDAYAMNGMLSLGFNKSQIGKANIMLLSEMSEKRKIHLTNNLYKL